MTWKTEKEISKVGPLKILIKLTKYYYKIPDIEKKTEITKMKTRRGVTIPKPTDVLCGIMKILCKVRWQTGAAAHAFNSSSGKAESGSKFEAILDYIVSFKLDLSTQ